MLGVVIALDVKLKKLDGALDDSKGGGVGVGVDCDDIEFPTR